MNDNPYNPDTFLEQAFCLAAEIERKRDDLLSLLCQYESHETALDEIDRSIRTLKGFSSEFPNLHNNRRYRGVSSFFPINLPLYSLVLFAIAPSRFAERVFVRPPLMVATLLRAIVDCINVNAFINNIELQCVTRKQFLNDYVKNSDVIIFNGRYENVQELIRIFPAKIFIYNGRGINPAIVGSDANIDLAVEKIVNMRVFNSGQDCAGVDVIFVADSIYNRFIPKLKESILCLPIGDYSDPKVRIGKMQRPEYQAELKNFLMEVDDFITLRGNINKEQNIITPYLIEKNLSQHHGDLYEFFGPVFYVLRYQSDSELLGFLATECYSDYAMYASTFGVSESFNNSIPNTRVLIEKNVNDVEIGNEPYGGYGPKANFIYRDFDYSVRPVLISRELSL